MTKLRFFNIILLIAVLISCQRNPLEIDVSQVDATVEVKRLDQLLFEEADIVTKHGQLHEEFGEFYRFYVEQVLRAGAVDDSATSYYIDGFVTDPVIREVQAECTKQFADFEPVQQELELALKHYKYYFPEKPLPEVVTFVSGFQYPVMVTDKTLGIGLDMFLGVDSDFYVRLKLPRFQVRNMTKERIKVDAIRGWVSSEYEIDELTGDLLSLMLHRGKLLYLMDAMMPAVEDSLKIGYTGTQLAWCQENELRMWAQLVENNLLYKTDYADKMKFINDGPFTSVFPKESPARTGEWLGWQIIRSYMEKNSNLTLQELMDEKSATKILNQSGYKPAR